MARRVRAPRGGGGYGEPVYTWAFASSQPRGGTIIQYETRLEEDGVIRCNCPGWIFCKGEPADKTCKHKKTVEVEAPDVMRRFRRGETLEVLNVPEPSGTTTGRFSSARANQSNPPRGEGEATSKARFGRVIEI